MFGEIVKKAGNLIHGVFIPVVRAAPDEAKAKDFPNEDVFERLKSAITPSDFEGVTPQVASFLSLVQNGFIFGCPLGAIIHAKIQYMDFMENTRAFQYKWHLDAKADLTSKMCKGAARGACICGYKFTILAACYGFLLNVIPVLRNEHSWSEYVISAVVTGTLGGHMFSDRNYLGFDDVKMKGKLTYRQMSFVKGIGIGLLFGVVTAVYSNFSKGQSAVTELKKWEKYWKQRLQNKDVKKES